MQCLILGCGGKPITAAGRDDNHHIHNWIVLQEALAYSISHTAQRDGSEIYRGVPYDIESAHCNAEDFMNRIINTQLR